MQGAISAVLVFVLFCAAATAAPAGRELPEDVANADTGDRWFRTKRTDEDLSGSPWADRGVLMLGGAGSPIDVRRVEGIPVGAKASDLRFVHTFQPGPEVQAWKMQLALQRDKLAAPPQPPTLFRYIVHYEDGTSLPINVRWGEGIGDWLRVGPVPEMLWAEHIWQQKVEQPYGGRLVVYAMDWPNPYPRREIATVDVVSANAKTCDWGTPAVFSVTPLQRDLPGRRYYVDLHGDDEAGGTFEAPWRTLHKAADALKPGDTVYVREGLHGYNRQIILRTKGHEGAWVTISAYPGESPVLDAYKHPRGESDDRAPHPHDWGFVQLLQPEYTRIQGLRIQNSRKQGINIFEGDHVDLLHNVIYRTRECAIRTYGHWWGGYDAAMTRGLTPRRGPKNTNIRIYGNRLVRPHAKDMVRDDRTDEMVPTRHTGHEGITIAWTDGFELGFNEISGCAKESIDCKNGNWNGRIHHNYIHHGSSAGIYVDGFGQQIENMEIAENVVRDVGPISIRSEQPGARLRNIIVHHNIIWRGLYNGINVAGSFSAHESEVSDVVIHHNTVYRGGEAAVTWGWFGGGIGIGGRLEGLQIRNNVVARGRLLQIHADDRAAKEAVMDLRNNLSWPYRQKAPERDGRVGLAGENAILQEPRFVDPEKGDFRLQPDSPARGAATDGTDLGALHPDSGILYWQASQEVDETFGDPALQVAARGDAQPVEIPVHLLTAYPHRTGWRQGMPNFWMHMNYDYTPLPTGHQVLRGVPWHIREWRESPHPTMIALRGFGTLSEVERADGIPVNRYADTVFFLHALNPGPAVRDRGDAPAVLTYVVHYADGSRAEVPVKWQQHIGHWLRPVEGPDTAGDLPGARVAWSRHVGQVGVRQGLRDLAVYCMPWRNPHPERKIATIDVVGHSTEERDLGSPMVLAITTGRK